MFIRLINIDSLIRYQAVEKRKDKQNFSGVCLEYAKCAKKHLKFKHFAIIFAQYNIEQMSKGYFYILLDHDL